MMIVVVQAMLRVSHIVLWGLLDWEGHQGGEMSGWGLRSVEGVHAASNYRRYYSTLLTLHHLFSSTAATAEMVRVQNVARNCR